MTKPPLDGEDFDSSDDDYNNYEEDEPAPNYASARSAQAGEHSERSWAHSNTQLQTAHKVWSPTEFQPLGSSRFDSLYFSYPGSLSDERREELHRLREKARNKSLDHEAQIQLNNHLFRVTKGGRNGRLYTLLGDYLEIGIGHKKESSHLAVAEVKIRSRWLLIACPIDIESLTRAILMKLCNSLGKETVTRADQALDFCYDDHAIETLNPSQFICNNGHIAPHYKYGVLETWSAGLGTDNGARLYNKTKQLKVSKDDESAELLPELWKVHGWDGSRTVWRHETQLLRDAIKQCGINTVADLVKNQSALWEKYSYSSMRLVIPNPKDKTKSRWPLHPLWPDVMAAGLLSSEFIRLVRKRPTYVPKWEASLRRMLGNISTMIAIDDVATPPDEYIENYIVEKVRSGFLSSGESISDFMKVAIKKKRQQLNIALNEQSLLPNHKSFEARKSTASKYNELLAEQGKPQTDEEDEEP